MTGIKDKFHSLSLSSHIPPANIDDGIVSYVFGDGIVHSTSSLV